MFCLSDTRRLAGVCLLLLLLAGCATPPQTRILQQSPPRGERLQLGHRATLNRGICAVSGCTRKTWRIWSASQPNTYADDPSTWSAAGGDFAVKAAGFAILMRWTLLMQPQLAFVWYPVLAALAAGFIYSIGAVIDKTGVMLYPPFHFTFLLVFFMLQFMTLNIMRPKYRGRIMAEYRNNRLLVIAAGPVIMASFLSFRYGLQLAPMSYAVPVRQVSLLIGVLIGVLFLGESSGRIRFSAAFLILCGAALIRLG